MAPPPAAKRRNSRRASFMVVSVIWRGDHYGIAAAQSRSYYIAATKLISFGYGMDRRRLRYSIAVAEEGLITRAAERLGMQQPPLSQQIKAMERELHVQLFVRKPRGVELTEPGRALLEDARALLA